MSVDTNRHWRQFARVQSAKAANPRPRVSHQLKLAADCPRQGRSRFVPSLCPLRRRLNFPSTSNMLPRMASFDPATVRQAVAEFTPRRPEKFQDLIPAKDVITELRQKRASYRAIAELLTQHCLPTSKTAVAQFCHEVLGEIVKPRRRPGRKRPFVLAASSVEVSAQPLADAPPSTEPTAHGNGDDLQPPRSRGPRIAQVRMLKPQTT